jgi:hypothetical protein
MDWQLLLEYCKVLLSVQMVTASVVILFIYLYHQEVKGYLKRITKTKVGGVEVETPQAPVELLPEKENSPEPENPDVKIQPKNDMEDLKKQLETEKRRSSFWEYAYLSSFLAPETQRILNWFGQIRSISSYEFDKIWIPQIPDDVERLNIINALLLHGLITLLNNKLFITAKGEGFLLWIWQRKSRIVKGPLRFA